MKKETIEDAIVQVLRRTSTGLTPQEITDKIMNQHLYKFHTNEPETVVDRAIRKSCVGVDIQVSKNEKEKVFKMAGDGRYKLREN